MLLKILTVIISLVVIGITYFYVDTQKDGPTPKSLAIKMVGATGYVAVGVLCVLMTEELTQFDKIMLGALICSWIGDLFLHIRKPVICTGLGFMGFLSSHVCFILAYLNGIKVFNPDSKFISLPEILTIAAALIAFLVYIKIKKMSLPAIITVPVFIYGAVITLMMCKAVILGFTAFNSSVSPFVLVSSILGALLFVMSDFSISILMFNQKQKKNFKLKLFNMYTFFAAEILLASLIYFI